MRQRSQMRAEALISFRRQRISLAAIRKALIDSGMPNPPHVGDWPLGVIVDSVLTQALTFLLDDMETNEMNPPRLTVAICKNCEREIQMLDGRWVHSEGYSTWCRPPQIAEPKPGTERSERL